MNLCIALALEGYPNRDSVAYKELYGLKHCQKVFRGTLRYKGFSLIICAFKELGLFDTEKPNAETWFDYMQKACGEIACDLAPSFYENFLSACNISEEYSEICKKIITKAFKTDNLKHLTEKETLERAIKVGKALKYFKLFEKEPILPESNILENLVK